MQDVSHDDHIRFQQRILEEVARMALRKLNFRGDRAVGNSGAPTAIPNHRWRNMRNYGNSPPMKLQQNQVWRQGDRYLRIVQLQRMSVDYKLMQDPAKKEGSHHHATKKDFCRLLKGATLVSAAGVRSVTGTPPFRNESVDAPPEPADTSMP